MTPFDYVKSINKHSEQLEITDQYVPFIINKAFSMFSDTIFYANALNLYPRLDAKMQYDFYYNLVPPKNRFSKWLKHEEDKYLLIVKEYYECSTQKAKEILNILDNTQLKELEMRLYKGGKEDG